MEHDSEDEFEDGLDHAGILERGIAWFLDGIVMLLIIVAVIIPLAPLLVGAGLDSEQSAEAAGMGIGLLVSSAYYIGTEAKWSQTPGKMALGLRVVHTDGRRVGLGGAIARNITKVLGGTAILSIIAAIVCILATEENQRIGDIIGETTVIRE